MQQWTKQGYLRKYYDVGDEPVYELTTANGKCIEMVRGFKQATDSK